MRSRLGVSWNGWTVIAATFLLAMGAGFPQSKHTSASAPFFGRASAAGAQDKNQKDLIARGEYQVLEDSDDSAIGTYAPSVFDFRESWALWRLPDGTLEADGQREYNSPRYEHHSNRFSVHLTSDFRTLGLIEFRKLLWRPDSGPLTCEFQPAQLLCTSGATDPSQAINLDMPMKDVYGFLWPISAFSISNITRGADKTPGKLTPVRLITVEELSSENPVFISALDGHVTYLGQENITLSQRTWRADKFELKVPLHPPFVIWTSPEGMLLRFVPEINGQRQPESGLVLVHFEQLSSF
jgi:hypothetical protein